MDEEAREHKPVGRLWFIGGILIFAMGFLVLRLWQVQVRHGREHVQEITRQSIRPILVNPIRGRIHTADGTLLVDNQPVYDGMFHVSEMRQPGRRSRTVEYILARATELSRLIGREHMLSDGRLERHLYRRPAMPVPVFEDLRPREIAMLGEHLPVVPGFEIQVRERRRYALPGVASHVIGVLGKAAPEKTFDERKFRHIYWHLEMKGRTGLEYTYDRLLAGTGGARLVRVNTLGYIHEDIGATRHPTDGKDLVLTLDLRAQKVAETVLKGLKGALVLLDVQTGAVVAMASSPTFDLSTWHGSSFQELNDDKVRKPLVNRAVNADYTPGSIVKPLIALAALEKGAIDPEMIYNCEGGYLLSPTARPIRCWNRYGHGPLALVDAITYSCNPYFINAGVMTGIDSLHPMFVAAGLGTRPKLDYNGVGKGICPARDFALSHWGRQWIAADTAFVSIGQGAIAMSPLQAALFVSAIANGGVLFRPHLVEAVLNPDGTSWSNAAPIVEHRLPVRRENLEVVCLGMERAVNSADGTAREAKNSALYLAGKTGTAQVGSQDDRHNDVWFVGYGPVDEPRYAIAIVVERGVSGGKTAAPLAGTFFRCWLEAGAATQTVPEAEG